MKTLFLKDFDAWLHYHDLGKSEHACVYLPGVTAAGSAYFPPLVAHHLLSGYRNVLIDPLGFGYSDRPGTFSYSLEDQARVAAALMDHLGLAAASVIGHSKGGSVAIVLARMRPDLVGRLIVAEANLEAGDATFCATVASHAEEEYVSNVFPAFLEKVRGFSPGWFGMLRTADPIAIHRTCVSLAAKHEPSLGQQLAELSIPRFYLISEKTLLNEPNMAEKATTLPRQGVQVLIIPGVDHDIITADDPTPCAQVIKTALTVHVPISSHAN